MTRKSFWIGSTGPFYYDDEREVNDPEDVWGGSPPVEGPLVIHGSPADDSHPLTPGDLNESSDSGILPVNRKREIGVAQDAAVSLTELFDNDCDAAYITMLEISIYAVCNVAGTAGSISIEVQWDDNVNEFKRATVLEVDTLGNHSKEQYNIALKPNTKVNYEITVDSLAGSPEWAYIIVVTEK